MIIFLLQLFPIDQYTFRWCCLACSAAFLVHMREYCFESLSVQPKYDNNNTKFDTSDKIRVQNVGTYFKDTLTWALSTAKALKAQ